MIYIFLPFPKNCPFLFLKVPNSNQDIVKTFLFYVYRNIFWKKYLLRIGRGRLQGTVKVLFYGIVSEENVEIITIINTKSSVRGKIEFRV